MDPQKTSRDLSVRPGLPARAVGGARRGEDSLFTAPSKEDSMIALCLPLFERTSFAPEGCLVVPCMSEPALHPFPHAFLRRREFELPSFSFGNYIS